MTRLVLPGMKERQRGAIVNIGSAAATVAPSGPLYAVYAGTKVGTLHLTNTSSVEVFNPIINMGPHASPMCFGSCIPPCA